MPAKKKNPSPAKQREEAKPAETAKAQQKVPEWPAWESKVERISGRSHSAIVRGWLAHIPDINPPGSAPRESIGAISVIDDILPTVPKNGSLIRPATGARPGVLHEALYLAHKAVHVEISCANFIAAGQHTWAVVDAYQASLFALGSIMCYLGLTVERHGNDFVLIDVWSENAAPRSSGSASKNDETYRFLRFKNLDHFHKWAILKRILRSLDTNSPLVSLLNNALKDIGDKEFARHRNFVNYQSSGWLAADLLAVDLDGPIKQAQSSQDLFDEIYAGSPSGTVYLMCALVELVCQFCAELSAAGSLGLEQALLDRRLPAVRTLSTFDWANI